jgi:hypothetical protein
MSDEFSRALGQARDKPDSRGPEQDVARRRDNAARLEVAVKDFLKYMAERGNPGREALPGFDVQAWQLPSKRRWLAELALDATGRWYIRDVGLGASLTQLAGMLEGKRPSGTAEPWRRAKLNDEIARVNPDHVIAALADVAARAPAPHE